MTFDIRNDIIRKVIHYVIEAPINTKVRSIDMSESKRNILDCETGFAVRVNFYIIKYLYKHLKLHDSFCDEETKRATPFYGNIITLNRQRFSRMLHGINFELSSKDVEHVIKEFNIPKEYFQKNGEIIEIYSLDKDDWKCYFIVELQCIEIEVHYSKIEKQRRSDKVKKQLKALTDKGHIIKNYNTDTCIYRILYYFQQGITFYEKSRLTYFVEALEKLKISDWKELDKDPERFQYCCNLLKKHYEYTWALAKCKELETN